jgi:hypothetical protein
MVFRNHGHQQFSRRFHALDFHQEVKVLLLANLVVAVLVDDSDKFYVTLFDISNRPQILLINITIMVRVVLGKDLINKFPNILIGFKSPLFKVHLRWKRLLGCAVLEKSSNTTELRFMIDVCWLSV